MNFLPENYEAPKSNSSYLKLEDGENRIRILTAPIVGWEDWKDKKPIRFRYNNKPEKPIDPSQPIRHFWAMIVWDYKDSKIKVFEITQASIRKRVEDLSKDKDWGSPYGYDIKITKSGQQKNTEYTVNPCPAREIEVKIKEEFEKIPVDLEELYRGGDPFAATDIYKTKAFWELAPQQAPQSPEDLISRSEELMIEEKISREINKSSPEWRQDALKALKIDSFAQMKRKYLEVVLRRIQEKVTQILDAEIPF